MASLSSSAFAELPGVSLSLSVLSHRKTQEPPAAGKTALLSRSVPPSVFVCDIVIVFFVYNPGHLPLSSGVLPSLP